MSFSTPGSHMLVVYLPITLRYLEDRSCSCRLLVGLFDHGEQLQLRKCCADDRCIREVNSQRYGMDWRKIGHRSVLAQISALLTSQMSKRHPFGLESHVVVSYVLHVFWMETFWI